ncbi:MAG: nucleotidyltransferase domain-containing protein [Candidatus Baldrarchaeia archaeon]
MTNLAKIFGDNATIVFIGSRAKNTVKTYSDFDLIIIYRDLSEKRYATLLEN